MRCPSCHGSEDRVIDSRLAEGGAAIRRRRMCLGCGSRFTTFERVEEVALVVLKRSGVREPFDRRKVAQGVGRAAKNRPLDARAIEALASQVEEEVRELGTAEVTTETVGRLVLERLRRLDPVASVRFASVYEAFEDLTDFEREVGLLQKTTAPKAASTADPEPAPGPAG